MLLVYRRRNAHLVKQLATEAASIGMRVLLWGLDGTCPSLANWTVGDGPGARNVLLSRLFNLAAPDSNEYVLIADDDIEFAVGGLARFLVLAHQAGFMLAQPTHMLDSHYSFRFTCGQPHLLARSTLFVEIGPMVLVHPAFRGRVFPLHAHLEMGWAEAVYWHKARARDERFGMIDAIRIRHLSPVGLDYDKMLEQRQLDQTLDEEGVPTIHHMLCTVDRWFRWQAHAPWVTSTSRPTHLPGTRKMELSH